MGGPGSGGDRTSVSARTNRRDLQEAILAIADANTDLDYRCAWLCFWRTLRTMGFRKTTQKRRGKTGL
jgi:hypothetical protein